jgi:HK97 family phage prohead protease
MSMLLEAESDRALVAPLRGLARIDRSYTVEGCEVRAAGDGDTLVDFFGHATVYGQGYEMYGGPDKGGWNEYVDAGAGKKTLSEDPDVAFLVNHTGLTLARTKAGTLTLTERAVGLETRAKLDTRVSAVNDLVLLMEAGNLDEMSFAFRVVKQVWLDADGEEVPWWDLSGIERHITEYSIHKGDVSVVNYGANPHTDAALRSLDDHTRLRAALLGEELPTERSAETPDPTVEVLKLEREKRARLLSHL